MHRRCDAMRRDAPWFDEENSRCQMTSQLPKTAERKVGIRPSHASSVWAPTERFSLRIVPS
eukprot:8118739-Pyramimonas_sp.AAC.1